MSAFWVQFAYAGTLYFALLSLLHWKCRHDRNQKMRRIYRGIVASLA